MARKIKFDIIASTGRTATTFIAATLDAVPGVLATHEGAPGRDKTGDPLLPLINLENARAYSRPADVPDLVAELRSEDAIASAMQSGQADHLIDVAYYNPMFATELLAQHTEARMIGLIRDCEGFVRSATTLTGEDPLPVGWPDPDKDLTDREKFIALGRIRPGRGHPDKADWANWGAIRRNIWLWHETNKALVACAARFPDRTRLVRFATFRSAPDKFWSLLADFLELPEAAAPPAADKKSVNRKPFAYQVGPASEWSAEDQRALQAAEAEIEEKARYVI